MEDEDDIYSAPTESNLETTTSNLTALIGRFNQGTSQDVSNKTMAQTGQPFKLPAFNPTQGAPGLLPKPKPGSRPAVVSSKPAVPKKAALPIVSEKDIAKGQKSLKLVGAPKSVSNLKENDTNTRDTQLTELQKKFEARRRRQGSASDSAEAGVNSDVSSNGSHVAKDHESETSAPVTASEPALPGKINNKRKPMTLPRPAGLVKEQVKPPTQSASADDTKSSELPPTPETKAVKLGAHDAAPAPSGGDFFIITVGDCRYKVFKLPNDVGEAPSRPPRPANVVLPSQNTDTLDSVTEDEVYDDNCIIGGEFSVIPPTNSDEEDDDSTLSSTQRSLPSYPPGGTTAAVPEDDPEALYEDEQSVSPSQGGVEEEEDLYQEFDAGESLTKPPQVDEVQLKQQKEDKKAKEREEKEREKEKEERKKREKEEKKRRDKAEKDQKKILAQKKKFKMDGSETVVFVGKAKDRIKTGKLNLEVLYEKGDDIEVIRVENNPPGKWLVQKDGKYDYVDIKAVDFEDHTQNRNAGGEPENLESDDIYEGEDFGGADVEDDIDIYQEF